MRVKQAQSLGKVSNDAKQQMRMHVFSGLTVHMGTEGAIKEFQGFDLFICRFSKLQARLYVRQWGAGNVYLLVLSS